MASYRIALSLLVWASALVGCRDNSQSPPAPVESQAQAVTSAGVGGHEGRRPHVPSPEAYTACATVAVGAACTLKVGDKEIQGKCEAAEPGAPDTRASCRPEGGHRGGPH